MDQYRKSPRASFLTYDSGCFFITICTQEKHHYFGEIIDGNMILSDIGNFVTKQLEKANQYCDYITVPLFVVMPNHIHAIVINSSIKHINPVNQRNPNPSLRTNSTSQRDVPTLSRYISSLKGAVTKYARANNIHFGWQPRYHDHLIRNTHEGNIIAEYISDNIARWATDRLNK